MSFWVEKNMNLLLCISAYYFIYNTFLVCLIQSKSGPIVMTPSLHWLTFLLSSISQKLKVLHFKLGKLVYYQNGNLLQEQLTMKFFFEQLCPFSTKNSCAISFHWQSSWKLEHSVLEKIKNNHSHLMCCLIV